MCVDDVFVDYAKRGFQIKCKCGEGEEMDADYFKGIVDEEILEKLKKEVK